MSKLHTEPDNSTLDGLIRVRCETELVLALEEMSRDSRRKMSSLVRQWLWEKVDAYRQEQRAKSGLMLNDAAPSAEQLLEAAQRLAAKGTSEAVKRRAATSTGRVTPMNPSKKQPR
jgi:hypothetical protein